MIDHSCTYLNDQCCLIAHVDDSQRKVKTVASSVVLLGSGLGCAPRFEAISCLAFHKSNKETHAAQSGSLFQICHLYSVLQIALNPVFAGYL